MASQGIVETGFGCAFAYVMGSYLGKSTKAGLIAAVVGGVAVQLIQYLATNSTNRSTELLAVPPNCILWNPNEIFLPSFYKTHALGAARHINGKRSEERYLVIREGSLEPVWRVFNHNDKTISYEPSSTILHRWHNQDYSVALLQEEQVLIYCIEFTNQTCNFAKIKFRDVQTEAVFIARAFLLDPVWNLVETKVDFSKPLHVCNFIHAAAYFDNGEKIIEACVSLVVRSRDRHCISVYSKAHKTSSFVPVDSVALQYQTPSPHSLKEHLQQKTPKESFFADYELRAIIEKTTLSVTSLLFLEYKVPAILGNGKYVSKSVWAVTLITPKAAPDHAEIMIEGVKNGAPFVMIAHLYLPKEERSLAGTFAKKGIAGTAILEHKDFKSKIARYSETWIKTKDEVEVILQAAADLPIAYNPRGKNAVLSEAHNCITWAIATLSDIGIVVERTRSSTLNLLVHPNDYLPFENKN